MIFNVMQHTQTLNSRNSSFNVNSVDNLIFNTFIYADINLISA